MEKNKIILLKDIGIYAIKENDWGLPQSILNGLFEILIEPLNSDTNADNLKINLYAFYFICNHFKNQAIAESDEITTQVILSLFKGVHKHFAENKIRKIRGNAIDVCIKDFYRKIIDNDYFYNLQPYLLRDCNTIIKNQIDSISYPDEELQTIDFDLDNMKSEREYPKMTDELSNYWFYINHELPDIIFNTLKHAIEIGNKNVYSNFNWQLHSIFDVIYNSKSLTEYQKNDAFDNYYYKAKTTCDLALNNGIYEDIDIFSNYQIQTWLVNDRKQAFKALYYFANLITQLNTLQKLSRYYIDNFFLIGRLISSKQMNPETKQTAFKIIINTGFLTLEEELTTEDVRNELIRQFKWLYTYLKKENGLLSLKKEFGLKIEKL